MILLFSNLKTENVVILVKQTLSRSFVSLMLIESENIYLIKLWRKNIKNASNREHLSSPFTIASVLSLGNKTALF